MGAERWRGYLRNEIVVKVKNSVGLITEVIRERCGKLPLQKGLVGKEANYPMFSTCFTYRVLDIFNPGGKSKAIRNTDLIKN